MPDYTKIDGVAEDAISKVSGVDVTDISKVSGQDKPAGVTTATRWIAGGSAGALFTTVVADASLDWGLGPVTGGAAAVEGAMVDLGGMNIKDIAYGEDNTGAKLWVIGTTSATAEIGYCEDDPDALERDFSDGATPRWEAVNLSSSWKAVDGGPAIAFSNTGGAGGTDRAWVAGGDDVGAAPSSTQSIKRSAGADIPATWTILPAGDIPQQVGETRSVVYKSGRTWFASNDNDIWTSTDDGATWVAVVGAALSPNPVYAMAYDGSGRWVAVGQSGNIDFSTGDWASDNSQSTNQGTDHTGPFGTSHIYGVVYCAFPTPYWVACSAGGKIGYSTDGDIWLLASEDVAVTTTLRAIATDGTTVVVVGDSGIIYTSTNGTAFTKRSPDIGAATDGVPSEQNLKSIACDIIGSGMR